MQFLCRRGASRRDLGQRFEGDDVVGLEAHANMSADLVVVVAGYRREHAGAIGKSQGVEKIRSAEGLGDYLCSGRAGIVMDYIVRA